MHGAASPLVLYFLYFLLITSLLWLIALLVLCIDFHFYCDNAAQGVATTTTTTTKYATTHTKTTSTEAEKYNLWGNEVGFE